MSESKLGYEKSDISVGKVFIFSFAPALLLVASIIGVHYYLKAAQFEQSLITNAADTTEIDGVRSSARRRLNEYTKNSDGSYAIPIQRAIELYTKD